jgi:hypothetical protein
MVKVILTNNLKNEIFKKFKNESKKVLNLIYSVKENPHKGKIVGQISGILIKELKYGKFRFYFISDGFKMKFLGQAELSDLVLKFVRMSDKKSQQKVIEEIKNVLRKIGEEGF